MSENLQTLDLLATIDPLDQKTWPRNKDVAQAYYDLTFDYPNHQHNELWFRCYQHHWNQHMSGEDLYIPF